IIRIVESSATVIKIVSELIGKALVQFFILAGFGKKIHCFSVGVIAGITPPQMGLQPSQPGKTVGVGQAGIKSRAVAIGRVFSVVGVDSIQLRIFVVFVERQCFSKIAVAAFISIQVEGQGLSGFVKSMHKRQSNTVAVIGVLIL